MELNDNEMDSLDVPAAPEAPDEAPATNPVEAVKASLRSAITAVLDDESLDDSGILAKIKEILKARTTLVAAVSDKPAEKTPAEPPAEEKTPESVQPVTIRHCSQLLEAAEVEPTLPRVERLQEAATEQDRIALIASWPGKGAAMQRPRSAASRPLQESTNSPKDAKEFADRITE